MKVEVPERPMSKAMRPDRPRKASLKGETRAPSVRREGTALKPAPLPFGSLRSVRPRQTSPRETLRVLHS